MSEDRNYSMRLSVAVAERLFAERALDPAGNSVADPDDGPEQNNGKGEHERGGHESISVISF